MSQTILGIDLGSYSVKISQVLRGLGEFKLVNFFEVPLVGSEVLTYLESASAALSKFFSENNVSYDYCVLSLPGNIVSFRTLEMPFANLRKIDQTLEFELETLVPFEIEEVIFDYTVLSKDASTSKVLVTYFREADFKKILTQVQGSGIDPRYTGVDTMDLSYLTCLGVLPPEGRYALLDLGHAKSNLIVLEGNKVLTARCFSWGGNTLTHAIARAAGLGYEEAEAFKHSKGQINLGSSDPIQKVIEEEFDKLSLQLKQTLFSFYESGQNAIEALYLSGGTSKTLGIEGYFSQKFNINVSHLDVLDESYSELHHREAVQHIIPTSFAAALHGIYPNKGVNLNFRRGEFAYKKDIEAIGGTLKKVGILAASVAGIGIVYFIVSFMMMSSQVDAMNKNITKLVKSSVTDIPKKGINSTKAALSFLSGKVSGIEEKLKKVEGSSSLSALTVLKMVSTSLPPREQLVVDIDDINITPSRVRLEGRTVSYEGVDKLKSSMEQVKDFKNVQTGNVRKGVRDEIKFSLSFDIEGIGGGGEAPPAPGK